MAVEAHNMNLFPPQFIPISGDFMKVNQWSGNMYNPQMNTCVPLVETMQETDSGVTCNMNFPVSGRRKRPRDASFDDVVSQIQQQQRQEIDRLIAQHIERVSLELEERRKRQSRALIMAIQDGIMKKLKEKDGEIQRMGKLNWVLQERVKSLCLENQLWCDMAQTNEATSNSLRTNLEQVLAHVGEERHTKCRGVDAASVDDAESSCGSTDEGWRKVIVPPEEQAAEAVVEGDERKCRKCGEKESSVLLLPCRHLCLCAMCGSNLVGTCPVCDSVANASVHVNMS